MRWFKDNQAKIVHLLNAVISLAVGTQLPF